MYIWQAAKLTSHCEIILYLTLDHTQATSTRSIIPLAEWTNLFAKCEGWFCNIVQIPNERWICLERNRGCRSESLSITDKIKGFLGSRICCIDNAQGDVAMS